ncbi:LCP family protein [Janibacter sp. G1551]|uniref:LCP family protein n=1 Tax=Janibacter sp. G1551 TaxID=3420440 RepID=UPI003CFC117A
MLDDLRQDSPQDQGRRGGQERGGHRLRRVVIALLAFVLLLGVGAFGFATFLSQRADDNLTRESLLPGDSAGADGGAGPSGSDPNAVPELKLTDKDKKAVTWPARALVSGKGENYLVIGSDARPGETVSRSDVIVLAHVAADHSRVDLIHFPRDLYVPIRGHGQDKINAAYAYGGAPLLVTTLQDLVGVKIDHVAKVDFEGFKNMTDAVGGVRVYAEEASNGSGNGGPVVIKQGWNDLDGEQALAFVRERYQLSEGDISRGRRQQAFIKALMLKTLQPEVIANPVKLTGFLDAATQNTVVDQDFTMGEMRSRLLALRSVRSDDIHFITAPFSGFGMTSGGASIDILDVNGMLNLSSALRSDDMGSFQG